MALDTREKRASAWGPFLHVALPLANGTVAENDRAQLAWTYVGISHAVASPPEGRIFLAVLASNGGLATSISDTGRRLAVVGTPGTTGAS